MSKTAAASKTDAPEVEAILANAARLGIELEPADDGSQAIRFRPRSAMTADLAQRIKANKPALLARLRHDGPTGASDTTPAHDGQNPSDGPTPPVMSVPSVSEQQRSATPTPGLWSEDELALLARAGMTPADMPLLAEAKAAFSDMGATVVSVETPDEHEPASEPSPQDRAERLIREAASDSPTLAAAIRDAGAERLAICTIDGHLSEAQAEHVALAELETMLH